MKYVKLLHNPTAGEEDHTKKELTPLFEAAGWECRYSSTKEKGWDKIEPDTDLIAVAGGDGTIRKAVLTLLERKFSDKKLPVAILPLGTANNIAKSLGIEGPNEAIISSWKNGVVKKYDIGRIEGLPETHFLVEGFGYGIFPRLMKVMKKVDKERKDTPEKAMQTALEELHHIILSAEARHYHIEIDDADHSGRYLLAEVMNSRSIGPNLVLSPDADPGDGQFEVVLIPEDKRTALADWIKQKMDGGESVFSIPPVKGTKININTEDTLLHTDDELISLEDAARVSVELQAGVLEFLIPDGASKT
ncbi:diacylglycerol kinase family protein [Paraflavitalea sp. CAU 1676]|uniref:diacylglycerol/lipid kinase family protein n=1 Tax=Paraflavitalea sp. CAU 1676 TaxID=3032598 RepID=UPI0023DA0188|nr:diacylglycerol kinase family protein [Paraflavitalea sp. CAU 1676]MDF2186948.1 diacylglycerol kinase family protein [Paraflavitalea sp. CAU 1676]